MAAACIVVREAGLQPAISLLNNRQGTYGIRLLAASRSQLTSDILLDTQREGEDQTKPGVLTEGNEEWAGPPQSGQVTLGECLAWAVTTGTRIDNASGTEYTVWVEHESFRGSIPSFASNMEGVARAASQHVDAPGRHRSRKMTKAWIQAGRGRA